MANELSFDEYQHWAISTAMQIDSQHGRLLKGALGLASEAGEVAGMVEKAFYQGHNVEPDAQAVAKELGDTLWYLAYTAHQMGWRLEDIARLNLQKLAERYPDGFSPEASKARVDGG